MLNQLLQHIESHSLLEPFQSAYRKCHSTETALLRVVNDLLQGSDSGHVSSLSLLDLLAAFDTIDHDILIKRFIYHFWLFGNGSGLVHTLSFLTLSVFVGHESTPSVLNVVCHRVQFWDLSYLLCTHSLSAMPFVNQATHTISLQMIPSSTTRVLPQTSQLLSIV